MQTLDQYFIRSLHLSRLPRSIPKKRKSGVQFSSKNGSLVKFRVTRLQNHPSVYKNRRPSRVSWSKSHLFAYEPASGKVSWSKSHLFAYEINFSPMPPHPAGDLSANKTR